MKIKMRAVSLLIKLRLFVLALCLLVVLGGCTGKVENPEMTAPPSGSAPGSTSTVPPNTTDLTAEDVDLPADGWSLPEVSTSIVGAFGAGGYYDEKDFVLTFTDLSSGTNVVLCSKPGCLHYDAPESEKKDCDAYIGMIVSMHYFDGKVYYVGYLRGSDDRSSLWLQRRNADGTGEEKLGRLASEYITSETSVSITECIFAGDKFYYRADVMRSNKNETVAVEDNTDWYLMRMDLNSGKEELLGAFSNTELPRLLAAREDALLYYTLPRLTEEEKTNNPDLRQEKPTKLRVWADSVKQSITLYSDKYKVFRGRGSVLGGKYYYPYYDNPESGEGRYKAYDLVTRQHEDTNLVGLPEINGRYAVCAVDNTYYSYLYDTVTGSVLPTEYDDLALQAYESNEEGIILNVIQLERGMTTPYFSEYLYILYSELEDGLQKTDGILMPLK